MTRSQYQTPPPLTTASERTLESYTDDELETLLFPAGDEQQRASRFNLPMAMGMATLAVGVLYVLGNLAATLLPFLSSFPRLDLFVWPTLAAALLTIVATATGLFDRQRRPQGPKIRRAGQSGGFQIGQVSVGGKRPLTKSNDRVIAGVAGGLADYFGMDHKLMRVLFVVLAAASQGVFLAVYLVLAAVLPKPPTMSLEERIRTIRDS